MANFDANGDKLMADAAKELKRWSLFGSSEKNERAADLYERAGNAFKAARSYDKAADAYNRAGDLHRKLGSQFDSLSCFQNQAECLKNVDPVAAHELLMETVVPGLVDAGKFGIAAKTLEKLADQFAGDRSEHFDSAIEAYEQAADYYEHDNSASGTRRCRTRLAELNAQKALKSSNSSQQSKLLADSISLYTEVGKACLEENLLKMNAKRYFFPAIICALAQGDAVRAENLFNDFSDCDYTFRDSREGSFAWRLIEATQNTELQTFVDEIQRYDSVSKIDPFTVSLLLAARRRVEILSGGMSSSHAGGDTSVDAQGTTAEEEELL